MNLLPNIIPDIRLNTSCQLFLRPIGVHTILPNFWKMSWKAYKKFHSMDHEVLEVGKNQTCKIFRFNQGLNKEKALIVHGWSSNSTHMSCYIEELVKLDYEVYALDLPAHGKSKGKTVTLLESVQIILDVQEKFGKFAVSLGHSFGGTSLVGAATFHNVDNRFKQAFQPESIITIASPTSMKTVVDMYVSYFKLSKSQAKQFRTWANNTSFMDVEELDSLKLIDQLQSNDTKFFCFHGENDSLISSNDSLRLKNTKGVYVEVLKELDHINVLYEDLAINKVLKVIEG